MVGIGSIKNVFLKINIAFLIGLSIIKLMFLIIKKGVSMSDLNKQQPVIHELVRSGLIKGARAVPAVMDDGYHLQFVNINNATIAVLESQRGQVRVFRTLDAVASMVSKLDLRSFSVTLPS